MDDEQQPGFQREELSASGDNQMRDNANGKIESEPVSYQNRPYLRTCGRLWISRCFRQRQD